MSLQTKCQITFGFFSMSPKMSWWITAMFARQDGSHVKLACMRNGTQSSPALQQSAAEVMQVGLLGRSASAGPSENVGRLPYNTHNIYI